MRKLKYIERRRKNTNDPKSPIIAYSMIDETGNHIIYCEDTLLKEYSTCYPEVHTIAELKSHLDKGNVVVDGLTYTRDGKLVVSTNPKDNVTPHREESKVDPIKVENETNVRNQVKENKENILKLKKYIDACVEKYSKHYYLSLVPFNAALHEKWLEKGKDLKDIGTVYSLKYKSKTHIVAGLTILFNTDFIRISIGTVVSNDVGKIKLTDIKCTTMENSKTLNSKEINDIFSRLVTMLDKDITVRKQIGNTYMKRISDERIKKEGTVRKKGIKGSPIETFIFLPSYADHDFITKQTKEGLWISDTHAITHNEFISDYTKDLTMEKEEKKVSSIAKELLSKSVTYHYIYAKDLLEKIQSLTSHDISTVRIQKFLAELSMYSKEDSTERGKLLYKVTKALVK